jgi:NAD(P)H-nitrite reductase
MDKSTIVCRCEEITVADIENAVRRGAKTFDDVKRLTRSGMGMCQGKTCQSVIAGLIAEFSGQPVADCLLARARMPIQPIVLEVLATARGNERRDH